MKEKIKKYTKEIIIFIILLTVSTNLLNLYKVKNITIDDSICKDGSDIVHFWATWCPICRTESSNIDFISKYYKVTTIAVNSEDIDKYLKQNNLHFNYIDDNKALLAKKYNISVFPTTITCKEKKVRFVDLGYTSTIGLFLRQWL